MDACIQSLPCCPAEQVDLVSEYPVEATALGGGKSGAFVFRLPIGKDRLILKYYADAYDVEGEKKGGCYAIRNRRPFREVLTLCRLSSKDGFPVLHRIICAARPTAWLKQAGVQKPATLPPHGLAAIYSVASGVELSKLVHSPSLTSDNIVVIGFRILHLLSVARDQLGPRFEHFDLHPSNVFVDFENTVQTRLLDRTFTSPRVTIIDFDLVTADFKTVITTRETQHVVKRRTRTVPVATLTFLRKCLGVSRRTAATLLRTAAIGNTDIRNWYVIMVALLGRKKGARGAHAPPLPRVRVCQNIDQCLRRNIDLLDNVLASSHSVSPAPLSRSTSARKRSTSARRRSTAARSQTTVTR